MTDERDYRKFKRFGSLVNYKRGMYDEITEQPNGEYVSDKDYLEACDEIDRLRADLAYVNALEDKTAEENVKLRALLEEKDKTTHKWYEDKEKFRLERDKLVLRVKELEEKIIKLQNEGAILAYENAYLKRGKEDAS